MNFIANKGNRFKEGFFLEFNRTKAILTEDNTVHTLFNLYDSEEKTSKLAEVDFLDKSKNKTGVNNLVQLFIPYLYREHLTDFSSCSGSFLERIDEEGEKREYAQIKAIQEFTKYLFYITVIMHPSKEDFLRNVNVSKKLKFQIRLTQEDYDIYLIKTLKVVREGSLSKLNGYKYLY